MMDQHKSARKARIINPDAFHASEVEKTKLNWFLFEYALEYEGSLHWDEKLHARLSGKGIDDRAIALFCIEHAKQMKGQVLARVSGKIANIDFGYRVIEALLPEIGDQLVDHLLIKAAKAWDSLTSRCVVCPTRCISERDRRATMFDDPFYRI